MSKKNIASSVKEASEETLPKSNNENLFRKIFFGSLVLMLGILWISGYDSGFGSDEMDMNIYGKANIAYYTSGFKDTTFLHPDHKDGVVPVSYTHLDVYKRQQVNSTGGKINTTNPSAIKGEALKTSFDYTVQYLEIPVALKLNTDRMGKISILVKRV